MCMFRVPKTPVWLFRRESNDSFDAVLVLRTRSCWGRTRTSIAEWHKQSAPVGCRNPSSWVRLIKKTLQVTYSFTVKVRISNRGAKVGTTSTFRLISEFATRTKLQKILPPNPQRCWWNWMTLEFVVFKMPRLENFPFGGLILWCDVKIC